MIRQCEAIVLEKPTVAQQRIGECTTCGQKGVLVEPGPLPRHVDGEACERQMAVNRIAWAHGRVKIGARR